MLRRILPLVAVLVAGCDDAPDWLAGPAAEPPAPLVSRFDSAAAGGVTGRVTWAGPLPSVPDFLFGMPKPDGGFESRMMPNPNRPTVDPTSRAVAGAVVFLRGIEPSAAKPWDLPPVRAGWADRQIVIRQGDRVGRVGFVQRGGELTLGSDELVYHVLRGRGADFFSLTLPIRSPGRTQTLGRPGRVELTSGAGCYWANADLFVTDHPYWAVTDREGRCTFEGVPAGGVEVVAWLPGWLPARQDRDPETGLVTRMTYSDPIEVIRPTVVESTKAVMVDFVLP